MTDTTLTFDVKRINIEPCGQHISVELNTPYINEILEDINDVDIIEYAREKVLGTMDVTDHLNFAEVSDVVDYYDIHALLECIGMDTILKFIRTHE